MIAPDDQKFLAGRAIPPGRIIVHAAVAHVHAIDDGIPKWPAALDDSPAHAWDINIFYVHASRTNYLTDTMWNIAELCALRLRCPGGAQTSLGRDDDR